MRTFATLSVAVSVVMFAMTGSHANSIYDTGHPPCASPTITKQSPAVLPPAVLSAQAPSSVGRCWLKPGLAATYRSNLGREYVQTFVGYPEKSEPMCATLVPPCHEWIANASGAPSFSDGDLNTLTVRYERRRGTPSPYYFVKKLFRWPLTIGDAWEADFAGPDDYQLHRRVKVTGWEDVRVPAGQFRAIRIEVHDIESRIESNDVVYYDPGLGITVKSTTDNFHRVGRFELVSLTWVDSLP